mmetsp:Transcript_37206/g.73715  ORF Transcript_37206/g.73715 Transcript_37206/m.73715 type:complete len:84 (+) Transcript_37206:383-634(+)
MVQIQWIFEDQPKGILRAKDIGFQNGRPIGHAVVVTGEGEVTVNGQVISYWKCKNSWGGVFGDHGSFRISKLSFPMHWLDVGF